MPGIQPALLKQLTKAAFQAHAIRLSVDWQQPQGPLAAQYVDAFSASERSVALDPSKLFVAASTNKYHVDQVNAISGKFEAFLDGICDALCNAHNVWKLQAKFGNIQVMAVAAMGAPGCLSGPDLKPLILMSAPKATPQELKYSQAVASAVAKCWKAWQDNVAVPGLPWYPAFAAFPGPQAPPMPNVPVPLASCPSALLAEMSAPRLKQEMVAALADPQALHHEALFDAIGQGLATSFLAWLPQQQVSLVLGQGPVPSFAPPFVPVGPVLGGDVISAPGHLMS
jgi:hypothetical protein